jgi:protein-export membrane protein SecD
MEALRDVIERRVNLFGVAEPLIQLESSGTLGEKGAEEKLIVELPGVTDVAAAVRQIGKTPVLEFKLLPKATLAAIQAATSTGSKKATAQDFVSTELTGRYLKKAALAFNQNASQPNVSLEFNDEGKDLFAKITREHVGDILAIFLDGEVISMPVINEEIREGKAVINGTFKLEDAKILVRDLNYGALPVPIELLSTQTVGASLGADALAGSVKAGVWSFGVIALFLILWYRLPGLVAVAALAIYAALNLAIFKLMPVTLTAAGIAGFILSIGMAVDANILIFERMREEFARGKNVGDAVREGFARAWLSIRDSNISSLITAAILFLFPSSSIIKGFALIFGLGVVVSMFTAITVTRTFLLSVVKKDSGKVARFLFNNGVSK